MLYYCHHPKVIRLISQSTPRLCEKTIVGTGASREPAFLSAPISFIKRHNLHYTWRLFDAIYRHDATPSSVTYATKWATIATPPCYYHCCRYHFSDVSPLHIFIFLFHYISHTCRFLTNITPFISSLQRIANFAFPIAWAWEAHRHFQCSLDTTAKFLVKLLLFPLAPLYIRCLKYRRFWLLNHFDIIATQCMKLTISADRRQWILSIILLSPVSTASRH